MTMALLYAILTIILAKAVSVSQAAVGDEDDEPDGLLLISGVPPTLICVLLEPTALVILMLLESHIYACAFPASVRVSLRSSILRNP